MLKIIITEKDFAKITEKSQIEEKIIESQEEILDNDASPEHEELFQALPKVLVAKIRDIMPEGFKIKEIEIKIDVEGKPFGIGLGGEATLRFGPK